MKISEAITNYKPVLQLSLRSIQVRILFCLLTLEKLCISGKTNKRKSINSSKIAAHKNDLNIGKENIFIIKGSWCCISLALEECHLKSRSSKWGMQ